MHVVFKCCLVNYNGVVIFHIIQSAVDTVDEFSNTALMYAIQAQQQTMVDLLLSQGANVSLQIEPRWFAESVPQMMGTVNRKLRGMHGNGLHRLAYYIRHALNIVPFLIKLYVYLNICRWSAFTSHHSSTNGPFSRGSSHYRIDVVKGWGTIDSRPEISTVS